MKPPRQHPLIQKLLSLRLSPRDFAIFGSGPMYFHGLRKSLRDIDVVARGQAWKMALNHPGAEKVWSHGTVIDFFGAKVQVVSHWIYGQLTTDELINSAQEFAGLRVARLEHVVRSKQDSRRPKDLRHIKLIQAYLKDGKYR